MGEFRMGRFSKSGIAVGVAALAIAGGGAYALAASSGSTITVCVSHKGGMLYKAKGCAKGDKKLTWNRQGPKGSTGPRGMQGEPGNNGAPGTARAYAWVLGGTTPSLDPNRTKGFTAVTHPGGHTGYYCLALSSNIVASQVAPAVSVVWNSAFAGNPEFAQPVDPSQQTGTFACTGNAIEVLTLSDSSTVPTSNLDFTVDVP
jgi:hypothetical protein